MLSSFFIGITREGKCVSKVLIVEDDQQLRELYADVLTDAGFIVKTASGGNETRALLVTFMPDVILLDLVIPEVTGFELLKEIKANKATKNIKIIIFTNVYADKTSIDKGVDSVLLKADYTPGQLIQKVREVLYPHQTSR